jgi:hypothetical protein
MNTYFIRKSIQSILSQSMRGKMLLKLLSLRSYFEEIGWFTSVAIGLPVDRDGNCLPWFTYPAISFLEGKVQSDMNVFEYGSGNSTLWWSQKVSKVISCEHDSDWYNSLQKRLPSNVEYRHYDLEFGGEYCKAILSYNQTFDIIVIDGRDRVNCAKNSLEALRENGVIIWDNSDRKRYREGYSYLIQSGFRRLDFEGLGPINNNKWCTSIFYRSNNCFGI